MTSWWDAVDVVALSRAYGFRVIDWGPHRGRGLLLCVGSGLMLAAMDLMPSLRWATDLSGGKDPVTTREWLTWMDRLVSHVAVAAWFTITEPTFLRDGLEVVAPARLASFAPGVALPGARCASLEELVEHVERRSRRSEPDEGRRRARTHSPAPERPSAPATDAGRTALAARDTVSAGRSARAR